MAWVNEKKPKFLGLPTGAVAGLATITPAAGFVSPSTAVIIGIIAGVVCYYAVEMKNKLHWDDALDVWGVHGVGGALGVILLGVFANKAFNPEGADGLLQGDPVFLVKQVVAVVFSSFWAFFFTYAMLRIIDVFTTVKVDDMSQEIGLDESIHGEHAYERWKWKTSSTTIVGCTQTGGMKKSQSWSARGNNLCRAEWQACAG